MKTNLQELNRKAGEGVEILLKSGYTISEIFHYDVSEEEVKRRQK